MDMPAAFAQVALAVSSAMGGPFHDARIITQAITQDDGGDTTAGAPSYRACSAQVDLATDAMRRDGFVQGEARFIILSASLTGSMSTEERVEVLSGPHIGIWQVSSLERDPAGIGWVGRGKRG